MLTKKMFIDAISAIVKHDSIVQELRVPLQKLSDFPVYLDFESLHRKALLDILKETTGDDSDWIEWWLYEDVDKIVYWEENGKKVQADLTEVGALYDFLLSNVENASAETLPLIPLDSQNSHPRQAIEKNDFLLYFDACLKHIDSTKSIIYICENSEPKYVIMSFEEHENR